VPAARTQSAQQVLPAIRKHPHSAAEINELRDHAVGRAASECVCSFRVFVRLERRPGGEQLLAAHRRQRLVPQVIGTHVAQLVGESSLRACSCEIDTRLAEVLR
jgi:hypothetical protein